MVQESTETPCRRCNRRHLLLCLGLVLGGGIAVFLWQRSQPVAMRLIGCSPLGCPGYTNPSIQSTRDYFLIKESQHKVACFGWDGTRRWEVVISKPILPPSKQRNHPHGEGRVQSVSPDGHFIAAAVATIDHYTVSTWCDGKLIGSARLRLGNRLPSLHVLSSGRVFLWSIDEPATVVYLIEGSKIIARGRIYTPSGFQYGQFSPDGCAFISSGSAFTYHTVTINGDHIKITPVYTASVYHGFHHAPFILRRDLLIAPDGAVYDDRGCISPPTNWDLWGGNEPSRDAIIQVRGEGVIGEYEYYYDEVRVFYPQTGQAWSPPQRERIPLAATPDGKYLLAAEYPHSPRLIYSLVSKVGNNSRIGTYLNNIPNHPYRFALYQQPGRQHAYLPIQSTSIFYCIVEKKYQVLWMKLSPDGKRLALVCSLNGSKPRKYYLLHYTW